MQGSARTSLHIRTGSNLNITPTITKDKKYVLLNIQRAQTDLLRMQTLVQPVTQRTNDGHLDGRGDYDGTNEVAVRRSGARDGDHVPSRPARRVPDRGTLLLGGHKLAAQVDKEVGVPILSKIPLLGRCCSPIAAAVRDQKILLILVKPTIILQEEPEQEADRSDGG